MHICCPPSVSKGFWKRPLDNRVSSSSIKLFKDLGGHPFHYLRLLGSKVLPPPSRGRLAADLPRTLLFFWDVLPRVLFHHLGQLPIVRGDLQGGVDALHGPQSVGPEVFVADQHPVSIVSFVGLSDEQYILKVVSCYSLCSQDIVRTLVGSRILLEQLRAPHSTTRFGPTTLLMSIQIGRYHVPRVPN